MCPYDLLRRAVAVDSARPFVTFYDDATSERVELSVATFDNWVSKTANLIQDGLALEPDDRVAVALPLHWQAAVVLMACWAAGVVVAPVPEGGSRRSGHAFASADRLSDVRCDNVVGLSLRPLGAPLREAPGTVTDYALEVPAYGDRFEPYCRPEPDSPALEVGPATVSNAELVLAAEHYAEQHGWAAGVRVLTTRPLDNLDGILAGLLAPLAAGGSVVMCRNAEQAGEGVLQRRKAAERITTVAG